MVDRDGDGGGHARLICWRRSCGTARANIARNFWSCASRVSAGQGGRRVLRAGEPPTFWTRSSAMTSTWWWTGSWCARAWRRGSPTVSAPRLIWPTASRFWRPRRSGDGEPARSGIPSRKISPVPFRASPSRRSSRGCFRSTRLSAPARSVTGWGWSCFSTNVWWCRTPTLKIADGAHGAVAQRQSHPISSRP